MIAVKLWEVGDRSRAVCERCKKVVATRFERRTVELESPRRVAVPNVLIAACVECGELAAIPPQSSPRLREARRSPVRVDVRIPRLLDDAMRLVADKLSARHRDLESPVVRHYLGRIAKDRRVARRIKCLLASPLATGPADARVTIRVTNDVLDRALIVAKVSGIENPSDLIRGIFVAAALDTGVFAAPATKPDRRSRAALAVIGEVVG